MEYKFPSVSLRYKMTVVVETPEGIKTGSTVRSIKISEPLIDLPDVGNPAIETGEAVVVDLGKRGTLFALLSDQSGSEFYQAFPVPRGGSTTADGIKYYKKLKTGLASKLNPQKAPGYPRMVMFKDINNPKSVVYAYEPITEKVRVYTGIDSLAEVFGKGVVLKEVMIETTDEPVTSIIFKVLPWLEGTYGHYFDGKSISSTPALPSILHYGDFKKDNK